MERLRRTLRPKPPPEQSSETNQARNSEASLPIRTPPSAPLPAAASAAASKRVRRQGSVRSTASATSPGSRTAKKARVSRPGSGSQQYLQVPGSDDGPSKRSSPSSPDSRNTGTSANATATSVTLERNPDDAAHVRRPAWTVRHRIYLDNELVSCTTSAHRVGYHKFADVLLREQIETRLAGAHDGRDAHFATRHAVLRFWRADGLLAEKWMDKDWGGAKEHEFAMENMNDWTILHLSMGGDEVTSEVDEDDDDDDDEGEGEEGKEEEMGDASDNAIADDTGDDEETSNKDDDDDQDAGDVEDEDQDDQDQEVQPTMDITSHYLSDYDEARTISGAPQNSNEAEKKYHWVEERRRNLEHQLRTYYHCAEASCFNKGGTCLVMAPGMPHLHVGVKDLTDWSQMIAHSSRSICATTLHLAAKLMDDQVRAQDERLADVGREREDEDDLGEVLKLHPMLTQMRPSQGPPAELDVLE